MASSPRLIDKMPGTLGDHDSHVQVLVLGMSRTGNIEGQPNRGRQIDCNQGLCVRFHRSINRSVIELAFSDQGCP